jgi:DNA processing protein
MTMGQAAGAVTLDPEGLRPWLTLANAPGAGLRGINRLLAHFGGPEALLGAPDAALAAAGARPSLIKALRTPRPDLVEAALAWAQGEGTHILARSDPRYPSRLTELVDAPLVLYVRGDPGFLLDPQLAMVGSRNPTPGARETTVAFARHLAACGLTITSGLALGIDGAAHEGALETGRTLAVMGTGPDRVYPAAHRPLARRIAAQGGLVTEFPPGMGPISENFPRRNRLIAALSLGTLVVEAAPRSGSLITARLAAEQGREVFAIPGSIHNPLARGCHALIKQGAKLVETAQDILEELAPLLVGYLRPDPSATQDAGDGEGVPGAGGFGAGLDADYRRLLEAMGQDPAHVDLLVERTGLAANDISSMLLMLELDGWIAASPGGRYSRVGGRGA